jgi:hypothetical protein
MRVGFYGGVEDNKQNPKDAYIPTYGKLLEL